MGKRHVKKASRSTRGRDQALVSMTGFGRATGNQGGVSIEVEVKSVNSRFLDCSLRLPREYSLLEPELRELVAENMSRGRVEVTVSRSAAKASAATLHFDRKLFSSYVKVYRTALKDAGIDEGLDDDGVFDILSRREVLDTSVMGQDLEAEHSVVRDLTRKAIAAFRVMRHREGAKLASDLDERLAALRRIRGQIREKTTSAPAELKRKLEERLQKLLSGTSIDEAKICTEAAFLADKIDVSEELVRLESHFAQFEETLTESPNGRKLEFLLQEFGREFNTISSKAQDAEVQQLVVGAKTEIEKIREQVQNVE